MLFKKTTRKPVEVWYACIIDDLSENQFLK